ncbi:hypothetical protein [Furfurilactobacillus siliginis]|uniref:Cthe-2314-like HEPN domain-containing protein n=1 Tax=Furfurilactobacillus siliginis TaxID=348151 RepID=A0A0R2LD74_9LACO|nr:hypothetical protein [Furfurilactobacillus siliginis]KRN96922.1 hypothetical protein IV55_GL000794 [Furfurilactobacillus siliginis]GEK28121.1 hypothetical protein LSI01_04320 [Furfurilactobacillus siliginis]
MVLGNDSAGQFVFEIVKTVLPALIAWQLSKNSSAKAFDKNRIEMRDQLKIARENNISVQNKTAKLQFCLSELRTYTVEVERCSKSYLDLMQGLDVAFEDNAKQQYITELNSKLEKFNVEVHLIFDKQGVMDSIVKLIDSRNFDEYYKKWTNVQATSNLIGPFLTRTSLMAHEGKALGSKSYREQKSWYRDHHDKEVISLHAQFVEIRNALLKEIDIVFRKMN